jgi:CRISPR associated protein
MIFEVRIRLNLRSSDAREVRTHPYLVHRKLSLITPSNQRVLWRYMEAGIVVRSQIALNWNSFDRRFAEFGERHHIEFEPDFEVGRTFSFNLMAYARGRYTDNWTPKPSHEYLPWFEKKAEQNGFQLRNVDVVRQPEYPIKMSSGAIKLLPAELQGALSISHIERFYDAFATGIGRMRGYGCGLLLIKL